MRLARRIRHAAPMLVFLCLTPAYAAQPAARDARVLESAVDLLIDAGQPSSPRVQVAARPAPSRGAQPADRGRLPQTANQRPRATAAPPVAVTADDLEAAHLARRQRIEQVLEHYYTRHLNSRDHNPWEVMHAIIAYGVDTNMRRGGPNGELVNAVSYVCWNGPCHGLRLLLVEGDRVNAAKGPYVQGHFGQFLAILAQSRVNESYPLRVGERTFTLADLIETEKLTCRPNTELTFKLISLSHYLDPDATWKSDDGQEWSIERLISEEIRQPILNTAACGGTHRLFGLSYAVQKRSKMGQPVDGQWARAEKYLQDYHRYTYGLQNDDGSFSTEWFKRRAADPNIDRRLKTSGHILEWFVFSIPEQQLDDPRVLKAVDYLTGILLKNSSHNWEIGPLGHGLHALAMYHQRAYGSRSATPWLADDAAAEHVAQRETNRGTARRGADETASETRPTGDSAAAASAGEPNRLDGELELAPLPDDLLAAPADRDATDDDVGPDDAGSGDASSGDASSDDASSDDASSDDTHSDDAAGADDEAASADSTPAPSVKIVTPAAPQHPASGSSPPRKPSPSVPPGTFERRPPRTVIGPALIAP